MSESNNCISHYTVKNNNQKLVQFHTKKCTRRNCTNFATIYKNSCENVLKLVWFGTKIKTSPTNFCRCLEFNIFLYEFLCKFVVYIFLCGFALIFDYYFLLCMVQKSKFLTIFLCVKNWIFCWSWLILSITDIFYAIWF